MFFAARFMERLTEHRMKEVMEEYKFDTDSLADNKVRLSVEKCAIYGAKWAQAKDRLKVLIAIFQKMDSFTEEGKEAVLNKCNASLKQTKIDRDLLQHAKEELVVLLKNKNMQPRPSSALRI